MFLPHNCQGALLWDGPDQDQWSAITRIMVDQMNQWIHFGQGFISSLLWSTMIRVILDPWSRCGSPQRNAVWDNDPGCYFPTLGISILKVNLIQCIWKLVLRPVIIHLPTGVSTIIDKSLGAKLYLWLFLCYKCLAPSPYLHAVLNQCIND